jgi:predicted nucleic acid-binding protein
MTRFTLDTNILIYAIDVRAGDRFRLSEQIVDRAARSTCVITLQSVSEFYWATSRKGLLSKTDAADHARDLLMAFPSAAASAPAITAALAVAVGGQASYWDALLIATAAEAGCTAILTEDMADGATLLGVRIVNPFAGDVLSAPAEALLRG